MNRFVVSTEASRRREVSYGPPPRLFIGSRGLLT